MIDKGGINSIIRLIHTIVNEKLFHYSRGSGGTGAPPIPPEVMKNHPLDPDDGPHTGALTEADVGFDDAAGHDHQGGGDTGKKVDTNAVKVVLTNETGGERTSGDVVVTDPDHDESFIGTSGSPGYQGKVLVVAETISSSGSGPCWERGGPFEVNVVGAVNRNDGLRTSATIYKAEAAPSVVSDGVFAIALSTCGGGGGTIKAVFLDVISEGGDGGVGTIEIQEDDAKVADADVVNFEGGGGKVTDEGGGKVTVDITPGAGDGGGGAWTLIEDIELGAPGATIDFQNIPDTYKHLKILFSLRTDRAATNIDLAALRLNNSAVGYDWARYQVGSGGITPSDTLNDTEIELGVWLPATTSPAGSFGGGQIFIPDYTDPAKLQGVESSGGTVRDRVVGLVYTGRGWGEWRTTDAITRVTLFPLLGTNFIAGSRATLYGIGEGGGIVDISARVYRTANQTIPHNTVTPINFTAERWDTDGIHDNAVQNTRLTCKTAGKYMIGCCVGWFNNAVGRRMVDIKLNGTTNIARSEIPAQDTGDVTHIVVTYYSLEVNDFIETLAYQSSGGNLDVIVPPAPHQHIPEFWMCKIA